MAKKAPNKTTRGRSKAQKSTNTRKKSNTSTRKGKAEKGTEKERFHLPAIVGGEHDTFVTLKKKAAMLYALEFHMGLVSPACKSVGIGRKTHYEWMKKDPGYAEVVEDILEGTFDFVEGAMLKKIKAGSETMQIWYSKTKMRHRGFVEHQEIEVTNKPAFIVSPEAKGVNKVMDVIHKKTGTNDKS